MTETTLAGASKSAAGAEGERSQTLSLTALSCLVVGSMVGGGIFSLPQAFGEATGILGALIAWAIAGIGMLMLAFVFQTLARRRPDIDAGIYAYARAGFGEYVGFVALVGYWASVCIGNVTFLVLVQSTLGAFFPVFGDGGTPAALLCASAILWAFHVMLLRGVKQAAVINAIVTVAKLLPLAAFLLLVAWHQKPDMLALNLFGNDGTAWGDLYDEVSRTMLIVVFVFLGIEGASVYSRLARKREDVGRATVLGFLGVFILLVLTTILPYGLMTRGELAGLHNPSVAGVLAAVIGPAGQMLVSLGVLVSVLGAFLAWSMFAAEVLYTSARQDIMPSFMGRENKAGAPAVAIWISTLFTQALLLLTSFAASAFRFGVDLTSIMSLIPYVLVGAYGVQLALQPGGEARSAWRRAELWQSGIATLYSAAMIVISGLKFLLLGCLLFAPATVLFVLARRERGMRTFTRAEMLIAAAIFASALLAAGGLVSGAIPI